MTVALLGDALSTDAGLTNNPESDQAWDLIREGFPPGEVTQPHTELVILSSETLTVDEAAFKSTVANVIESISTLDEQLLVSIRDY